MAAELRVVDVNTSEVLGSKRAVSKFDATTSGKALEQAVTALLPAAP